MFRLLSHKMSIMGNRRFEIARLEEHSELNDKPDLISNALPFGRL